MAKFRVPLFGSALKSVTVDSEATKGATLGRDLYRADGSVVTEADLAGTAQSGGTRVAVTLWKLIQQIPANIAALAALATDGWIRRDGAAITARELAASDSSYSNTTSGLVATNAQAALDELASRSDIWTVVKKTANQTKTSNATLANDSQLSIALAAGTHRIRASLMFQVANGTMDIKLLPAFSGTVGAVTIHLQVNVLSGTLFDGMNTAFSTAAPNFAGAGSGFADYEIILTATTSGTFAIQWAQNVSDAGACTMLAGSYIEALKFA